jgi:hypothetical protein
MRHDKGSAMVFTIILLAIILIVGLASFTLFHRLYLENIDRQEDFQARVNRESIARDLYTEFITILPLDFITQMEEDPDSPPDQINQHELDFITQMEEDPDLTVTYDNETGIYTIASEGFSFTFAHDNGTGIYTFTFEGFSFTVDKDVDDNAVPHFTITSWQHTA